MMVRRSLVLELEDAIASSDVRRRAVMLRRVADLFVESGHLTAQQMLLLDELMERLVTEVETVARVQLSEYLSDKPAGCPRTIRKLALDDLIEVARPVLKGCEQIDDATLEEGARTKSQAHLLAISCRKRVPEPVTEVLLERGNRDVVLSVARNPGACLSALGSSSLVQRSAGEEELIMATWVRSDIPRRHLLKMFSDASSTLRDRLIKEDPVRAKATARLLKRAVHRLQDETRPHSPEFLRASVAVRLLEEAGRLDERALREFATSKRFAEAALSLSIICDVPNGVVERALIDDRSEQILVLTKAAELRWDTTKALLMLQMPSTETRADLDKLLETFLRLRPETARRAVQFYRLRERAGARPEAAPAWSRS